MLAPDGLARLRDAAAAHASGSTLEQLNAHLRSAGTAPDLAAAIVTQVGLRETARAKFGDAAGQMLFTQAGLEQATRAQVSELHARRFADAGCARVADLGCGIGAESLAFQSAGLGLLPVEIDPFTAAIASHNLGVEVRIGDAETTDLSELSDSDGVFLDPARRTAGHRDTRRLTSPSDYSPSLDFAFGLADRFPTGVKLGPGFDRDLIPPDAEAQWVSVDGQLVETGLWFGAAARAHVRRAALVIHGTTQAELTADADAPDAETRGLGEYLYEPDGSVIRARLIGALATDLDAGMVGDGIAYLTGDRYVSTPFAQAFRIIEHLPAGEKHLRRALAQRGIGRLEIKKRGVPVDPATLRKRLNLSGPESATLILTRARGAHVALLAERVTGA